MPLYAVTVAIAGLGFEQLVQVRYGPLGLAALLALTIGLRARNAAFSGTGAAVLVLLLAHG
ncbi:hypothetical protein [Streptomyces sp. NPDC058045]|uniref:hypothetical protein n=1 Tax=Streptomyces sp. NPDC058045 TaxID=3346311 RepID=UPI0036E1D3D9